MRQNAIGTILLSLLLSTACAAQTATAGSSTTTTKPEQKSAQASNKAAQPYRWYVKASVAAALYHSKADIKAAGTTVPGASAKVTNQPLELIDVGYNVKPWLALNFMTGIPAKPKMTGTGTVAAYGTLGNVLYGPGILSAQYHDHHFGRFQPYAGGGAVYAIMFKNYDGAIKGLEVKNHWGSAVMCGADYEITRRWGVFAEAEQLWLAANATGKIAGVVPASAHVQLNPSKLAVGVKYSF